MAKEILFSVVVPVYRVEKYLNFCVESLCNQTYSNLEIILVDDGSPDNCPALCDAYAKKDSRIRVIHQKNGGASKARKAGAELATGEYLCFVDSDDYIELDYFEKMKQVVISCMPDILCCGAFLTKDGESTPRALRNRYGFYSRADIEKEIFPLLIQSPYATYFPPSLWAKAIKTDIFRRQILCVDETIIIGEDGACIIPCVYEAASLFMMPECLYYYRENDASLTRNCKAFQWDGPKLIAEHLARMVDLQQFDFLQQWYRKTVHELFTVVKSQFNRDEDYRAIALEIKEKISDPIYQEAINHCDFLGRAGKLACFALKHRQIWMIWLFHKLKKG